MSENSHQPNSGFDKLAGPYRFLEYLTFGPLLTRTRLAFLAEMRHRSRALVLGDGDGRFCEALLRTNPHIVVTAIDSSPAMLQRLQQRAAAVGSAARLSTHLQDVRGELPAGPFDLVCTHFLLDCLNEAEVRNLVSSIRARTEEAQWIVSEFAIPTGIASWPARLLVDLLYLAFGLLTGLQTRQLPRYADILYGEGFRMESSQTRLFGVLRSEVWVRAKDVSKNASKLEEP